MSPEGYLVDLERRHAELEKELPRSVRTAHPDHPAGMGGREEEPSLLFQRMAPATGARL